MLPLPAVDIHCLRLCTRCRFVGQVLFSDGRGGVQPALRSRLPVPPFLLYCFLCGGSLAQAAGTPFTTE